MSSIRPLRYPRMMNAGIDIETPHAGPKFNHYPVGRGRSVYASNNYDWTFHKHARGWYITTHLNWDPQMYHQFSNSGLNDLHFNRLRDAVKALETFLESLG